MRTIALLLALARPTWAAPVPLRFWAGGPDAPLTAEEELTFLKYVIRLERPDQKVAWLGWQDTDTDRERRALVRWARVRLSHAQ